MSECNRCGLETERTHKDRPCCINCLAYFELQDEYVKLQDDIIPALQKRAKDAEAKCEMLEQNIRNLWSTTNA